jgi:hypothetical protein
MAQLFRPGADTIARIAVYGALPTALAAWWIGYELYRSDYVTQAQIVRPQPVPFSHEHHAGGLGIDCRYCHAGAERSPFAGMPSAKTCMTCHSRVWTAAPMLEPVRESFRTGRPIAWTRVAKLPDFVFFDHSIHLARGLACADCHGRVDRMPLTYKAAAFHMKDCLRCHRDARPLLDGEAREDGAPMQPEMRATAEPELERLVRARDRRMMTDCYTCHR